MTNSKILSNTGASTNFGLLGDKQTQWQTQIADETRGDFYTTYGTSYTPVPATAMARLRYATAREVSTPLHRPNSINKNLHFRGTTKFMSPEMIEPRPVTVQPAYHAIKCSPEGIVY